jgi:hypothetical protein
VSAPPSKTALADLVSLDRRDDRLWRMGYDAGRHNPRRPRRCHSWPVWWLVLPVTAVLAVLYQYRLFVGLGALLVAYMAVWWAYWGRSRLARWAVRRWVRDFRF